MADLTTRANHLRAAAQRLRTGQLNRHQRDQLAEQSVQLSKDEASLRSLLILFSEALSLGVITPLHMPRTPLLNEIAAITGRLTQEATTNPEGILAEAGLQTLHDRASRACRFLDTLAREFWRRYCTDSLGSSLTPLLGLLESDPRTRPRVGDLRTIQSRIDSLAALPLPSEAELRELVTLLKRKDLALDDLPIEHDPEVVRFLRESSKVTGASLEMLTSRVLDWLRTNKLSTQYVVRARE